MSFENVSTGIIKDSISSAIYIDDKILLPYEEKNGSSSLESPSDLYSSFRKNYCSLDFVRFTGPIDDISKTVFYNRDLLIMDWHLDSANDENLAPSFHVLEQAVLHKNLHFCVIYTSEEKAALSEKIIYNIASYFSGLTKKSSENARIQFAEVLDNTGLSQQEINKLKSDFVGLLIQLAFAIRPSPEEKEIMKSLINLAKKIFGDVPRCNEFVEGLSLGGSSLTENLIALGFALNENLTPEVPIRYDLSLPPDKLTIRIKNLFVKVFSKKAVEGDSLYDEFKRSLISESNIFLTLLGLEIRSRFRESSAFISRELEGINHLAFFYHKNSHFENQDELFNEFLKDIWKDQIASFLLEHDISLFRVLEEYKAEYDIDAKLQGFKYESKESREALARLNFVYNRLAIKRKENDQLRFGDVFYFEIESVKTFLMCLTPHCDCLRPGKIKNMFFFVEGKEISESDAIKKGDGDYISYIKDKQSKFICIDWTMGADDCKPFTLYIEDNRMKTEEKLIETNLFGQKRSLTYIATIKENYAQRVANKAFFYPLRVGIDFASFQKH